MSVVRGGTNLKEAPNATARQQVPSRVDVDRRHRDHSVLRRWHRSHHGLDPGFNVHSLCAAVAVVGAVVIFVIDRVLLAVIVRPVRSHMLVLHI